MTKPDAVKLYGIKNCDTVKKARAWLDAHKFKYDFHDYKTAGIERGRLQRWVDQTSWEVLLNRSGTTFRKLPDSQKVVEHADAAIELMLAHPTMIKRPVLEIDTRVLVGFKPEVYEAALARMPTTAVDG